MDAASGCQAHEVNALAVSLRIAVSRLDFRVFQNGVVSNGTVDLHQILINDAPGTDIEVSRL